MGLLRRHRTAKPPLTTVRHVAPAAPRETESRLADLEAQSRYHAERLALYRARMQGSQPTSVGRLEELEHAATAAADRLETARRAAKG